MEEIAWEEEDKGGDQCEKKKKKKRRDEIDRCESTERFRFSSFSSSFFLWDRIPPCPEHIRALSRPYWIKKKKYMWTRVQPHPASHTSLTWVRLPFSHTYATQIFTNPSPLMLKRWRNKEIVCTSITLPSLPRAFDLVKSWIWVVKTSLWVNLLVALSPIIWF